MSPDFLCGWRDVGCGVHKTDKYQRRILVDIAVSDRKDKSTSLIYEEPSNYRCRTPLSLHRLMQYHCLVCGTWKLICRGDDNFLTLGHSTSQGEPGHSPQGRSWRPRKKWR